MLGIAACIDPMKIVEAQASVHTKAIAIAPPKIDAVVTNAAPPFEIIRIDDSLSPQTKIACGIEAKLVTILQIPPKKEISSEPRRALCPLANSTCCIGAKSPTGATTPLFSNGGVEFKVCASMIGST